jgi:hypothetical protein
MRADAGIGSRRAVDGERSGIVEDIGGPSWELTQTVRDVAPKEWGGATIAPW